MCVCVCECLRVLHGCLWSMVCLHMYGGGGMGASVCVHVYTVGVHYNVLMHGLYLHVPLYAISTQVRTFPSPDTLSSASRALNLIF